MAKLGDVVASWDGGECRRLLYEDGTYPPSRMFSSSKIGVSIWVCAGTQQHG